MIVLSDIYYLELIFKRLFYEILMKKEGRQQAGNNLQPAIKAVYIVPVHRN